jgi:NAD(P)-dependent dehydrogenase (short-subunit alcohol dehydrogenase family)
MMDFIHKIVLITGAAGGKGRELAEALAARGASIAAVDINPFGLDVTVQRIREKGGTVKDYIFDTAKRLPIVGLVDSVLDDWERIDILVCASVVRPTDPILSMDEWEFHRTLDVNLAGPFFLMQRVGQVMKAQGGGVMLIVGDEASGGPAYRASQAALSALVLAAQDEFKAYNIDVIALENFMI